jgi:hypothetical protein
MQINPSLVRFCTLVLCISASFAVNSCGLVAGKDPGATSVSLNTTTVGSGGPPAAFVSGFYAFATAQGSCIQCHASGPGTPMFAVSDPSAACGLLLPYINMTNPSSSTLAINAGNNHCGIASICGSSAGAVASQIQSWAAGVAAQAGATACTTPVAGTTATTTTGTTTTGGTTNNCPANYVPASTAITYTTAAMPIPSPLPSSTATTGAVVTWKFPAGGVLPGSIFDVQIQEENAGTSSPTYRVILPRMIIPTSATANTTTVAGLHVLINGCEFPTSMDWSGANGISTSIAPITFPATIPTPLTSASLAIITPDVIAPVVGAGDKISIGFETLATTVACKNLAGTNGFESNVLPTMMATSSCISCHGGTNAQASLAFPMVTTNLAALCALTLTHVNLTPGDAALSLIVVNPEGQNGHPTVPGFSATPFINWINTE